MRTLERNKQLIYYSLYQDKVPLLDEYGNETGEYEITYTLPAPLKINVSPPSGESVNLPFGNLEGYDKILVTNDLSLPIDEQSILWIDDLDTTKPHNYEVKKVAKSLNTIQIAVRKVNISA